MWRICRKSIFPRWHVSRQKPVDNKNQNFQCSKVLVLHPATDEKGYSNENSQKQHANKQQKKCWDDPQFQFSSFHLCLLQTVGWAGTAAALCLNTHFKHIKNIFEYDRPHSPCPFSRNVLAMPKYSPAKKSPLFTAPVSASESPDVNKERIDKISSDTDILRDIKILASQYAAAVENSVGIANVNKNDRKAFRYFQTAAKLGSSQAFYNLGLCYELGKGTRINLRRAAFCYKQAAMKGHGLAAFNLAVYFLKGIGGHPVDVETGKLLLAEAASKGVPEAQTYIGLECLEEGKWFDAVAIFMNLSERNISDGQYYLGLCYENGWGVYKNNIVAAELFAKSARQGHQKATLKLANYYEEGKGGCQSNHEFACSLYQILNDLGNTDAKNALSLLQAKQAQLNIEKSLVKSGSLKKTVKSSLHLSASVPEFSVNQKLLKQDYPKFLIPTYLDLMTPFISVKIDVFQSKPSFAIGDDELVKKYPSCFISNCSISNISHVMRVKT